MPGRKTVSDRRRATSRRAGSPDRQALPAAVIAAGLLLLAAGCTSTATSEALSTEPAGLAAAAEAAPQDGGTGSAGSPQATGGDAPQSAAVPAPAGSATTVAPVDGRQVILTATLAVTLVVPAVAGTDDAAKDAQGNTDARREAIARASGAVRGAATAAGGYVSEADGAGSTTTLTVRVPAEEYDGVVDGVAALGVLTGRSETSKDVTAEIVDVNSRVESMTASVARVRALLAQATGIGDVIAIESELATREADLESLQRQQASLAGLVALSTVSVTFTAVTDGPAAVPGQSPNGFVTGLTAGWNALLESLAVIGTVVGAMLPFLPVIAALAVIGWWVARRARSRQGRQAPVPAPADVAGQ